MNKTTNSMQNRVIPAYISANLLTTCAESTSTLTQFKISRRFKVCLPLITSLVLILAGRVTAQTFTTLHTFAGAGDGANPVAGLLLSGNTLYGTAYHGGVFGRRAPSGLGTVFALNTDGTGFTNLHSFLGGSDGMFPVAGLIASGNTLYGTASRSFTTLYGNVFRINTDGTAFTTLFIFGSTNGTDGAVPLAGLTLSGNTLYGTASYSGVNAGGTVFALATNGTAFRPLGGFGTRHDGSSPEAGLVLSGNTLYGTTYGGGRPGLGTVFKVNTDGTGFRNLYSFTGGTDGANPYAGVILSSSNTLYGTAYGGGGSGKGTVFKVNTDGTGFTLLYSFTGGSDGANPYAGVILSGSTLYGTAYGGGSSSNGTVFAVRTDGSGFATLYGFTRGADGANPKAGLILAGNTLYGTASNGGSLGKGTVFSLSLPQPQLILSSQPELTITPSARNAILTWPANYPGYRLESTTNLGSEALWGPISPIPVVVNGQNVVTNPISGVQHFYRLSQ